MGLTYSGFTPILKELYDGQAVKELLYTEHPFMAALAKNEETPGKSFPIPLAIGGTASRSATFATAQGISSSGTYKEFQATLVQDYAIAVIDRFTMKMSESSKGAFVSAVKIEVDLALKKLGMSMSQALFRDGTGNIGQISSGSNTGTATITLTNVDDIVNFEIGQVVQASANANGSSARTGTATITALDRTAGTLTISGNWTSSITSVAASDYLFSDGDIGLKAKGLAAWLPYTAPTAGDSFFGVDRSVDPVRLAGVRYDASASTLEEGLINAAMLLGREQGKPNLAIMNFTQFGKLVNTLGSKVIYNKVDTDIDLGIEGVKLIGPKGPMTVIADANCPLSYAYLLDTSSWELRSMGPAPEIQPLDGGGTEFRQYNADGVEIRCSSYFQLCCNAPGHNAVINLPTL